MSSPITVFWVEYSAIAQQRLAALFQATPGLKLVGSASNGVTALERIPQLQPDVICTNLQMPKMDGFELIRQLLAFFPRPILVVSPAVQPSAKETISQVLKAGAVDVFPAPETGHWTLPEQQTLINRIKVLAGVKVFTKPLYDATQTPDRAKVPLPVPLPMTKLRSDKPEIVAIGASTGGPQAIHAVLKQLPSDFPLPILCTQHISAGFLAGLVSWQGTMCRLRVKIAEKGEVPVPGTVYFAPDEHHLSLDSWGRCRLISTPPVHGHRPAITAMFEALAQHYGAGVLGILLTGMGQDGAVGLQAIDRAGGITVAQNEASSVVFGMPKVAIDLGAAQQILPVDQIASFILKQVAE